jgi:hypothetical protein
VVPAPRPAQLRTELSPGVLAAAIEGIPVFPIPQGARQFDIKRSLWSATTEIEGIRQMAADTPECAFGMAMGGTVFAIRMDSDFGVQQFNSMVRHATLTTSDGSDWTTRFLRGGGTSWALYIAPEFPERRPRPSIGEGLAIVGRGGWLPAPGDLSGTRYRYLNPQARIAEAPRYIASLAFEVPGAGVQPSSDPEDPDWNML